MTQEISFECPICGYEFNMELAQADLDLYKEVHNRIHKGEFQ